METDRWDQWLDEYLDQQFSSQQDTPAPAPEANQTEPEPSRTSGWYTGQRRHPSANRKRSEKRTGSDPAAQKEEKEPPKPQPKRISAKPEPVIHSEPTEKPEKVSEKAPEKAPEQPPKASAERPRREKKAEKKPIEKSEQKPEEKAVEPKAAKSVRRGAVKETPTPIPTETGPKGLRRWQSRRRQRITGIRRRWLVNSMSMVALVVVLVVILATILMGSYFYSAMETGLETKVKTAAEFFTNYTTESEYREQASYYVSNFSETDSVELEFLNSSGEIILSSYAYQQTSGVMPGTVDVINALTNGTISTWSGSDSSTGERITAVSAPVVQNGSVKGVIRMVTSTRAVDRQVMLITLLIFAVGAAVLALIYLMNLYFVRSIIEPMAAITDTAKRIAAGSYGVQIEKTYDDEIGELADTINDMSLKISQTEKMKSEFISSVSHELRTPLTAINGWGETLLRGEVTDPRDVHKGMAIIVSEAKRLTKMVEELLEFSRIEDGRFTLRMEMVDIKAELEDAVYTYREFFRKKGISLEYNECEEEFPPIPGDPERLRQVFSNLLDNAAKHGGSGKRITVSIFQEGESVAIRIRDYGAGIPVKDLPHVKTKFYKGSSKVRGSGIGLAVCDEIAVRHNGSLEIGNAVGGGCVVTLRLPFHGES